ncbi:MAG: NAD(P)/FAD-dependent oxidoreductase [Rhodoferax sp.]
MKAVPHIAIVGAGMAGIACARTLLQAGQRVTVLEAESGVGGRMASHDSAFGSFDLGAQYFTVRDERFAQALQSDPGLCRPWSANAVRTLDEHGAVLPTPPEQDKAGWVASSSHDNPTWTLPMALNSGMHWVGVPRMQSLLQAWAAPLQEQGCVHTGARVRGIEADPGARWRLHGQLADGSPRQWQGFDAVVLAVPAPLAQELLGSHAPLRPLAQPLQAVRMAPGWALALAYAQAMQPGLNTLGPQWNAARSTHHRVSWLARESSKPQRGPIERWTVQASAAWSQEHLLDAPERVQAKLQRAFAEITGIHAQPHYAHTRRWAHAKTLTPLRQSHLWDAALGVGLCGDWCLGYRVEDAFVSGLELALATLAG